MPDSIDPTELLAHAKPITNYEIDSAHLTQMVNRVTSTPVPVRFPLLRTWQMKAGSAVAGAALVATGVVVAISGAPQSLSVLALPSNTPIAGPAAHAPATLAPVALNQRKCPPRQAPPQKQFARTLRDHASRPPRCPWRFSRCRRSRVPRTKYCESLTR